MDLEYTYVEWCDEFAGHVIERIYNCMDCNYVLRPSEQRRNIVSRSILCPRCGSPNLMVTLWDRTESCDFTAWENGC
ncbi:hypothetical protein [Methanooceanicella nereidis]|uniref:hypothetical protein n=1 Tax=Methanooceanicella nereidis TaxID=2052831 RepID=UPI001E64BF95|nr:hypothetical protein [Methanocella sp. CWC-04]